MRNALLYGREPYRLILVHGGPGASGELAPVARRLERVIGIVEALQTKKSVEGQLEELREIIESNCEEPVILLGYSWGAMLGVLFVNQYPKLVKCLILVSSGPFDSKYRTQLVETRESRMTVDDKMYLSTISLEDPQLGDDDFRRIGEIFARIDSYALETNPEDTSVNFDPTLYSKVWGQAEKMREKGEFIRAVEEIPQDKKIWIVHGEHDPHPLDGVVNPFLVTGKTVELIKLENCGHTPWREKYAKQTFYRVLEEILRSYQG